MPNTPDADRGAFRGSLRHGATLIGAILAARVRKIGAVEFYEGIPEELAELLKAGESVLQGFRDLGPGGGPQGE